MQDGMSARTARILIVDDDPGIRGALSIELRRAGYEVEMAESPRDALSILERQQFDLALLDHDMPGSTGVELAARLRVLYPRMVRMLLTGRDDFVTAQDAINRGGVYRYILKPWDSTRLHIELALALNEARRLAGDATKTTATATTTRGPY
jgi:DNA-binding NtrC family response regulator